MKHFLSLHILIGAVAAQGLNGCGQMCWNNMVGQASSLGCSNNDMKCLCANPNFQNGLNDCSRQACGDAVRAAVVAYGRSQCGNQGAIQGGTSAGGIPAATPGSPPATATETTTTSETTQTSETTATFGNATTTTTGSETSSTAVRTVSGTTSVVGGGPTSTASAPATATGFAMKTAAPFAGAGVLGLAAVFLPLI